MAILVDRNTRVLIQGITGRQGREAVEKAKDYPTQLVAGVSPGKGGEKVNDTPVFETVEQAVKETGADASMVLVPAPFAADAIMEAVDAGIRVIVCITEGVPVRDMLQVKQFMKNKDSILIGPNCPGVLTPGQCHIGVMPTFVASPGQVGVVSRSGTLTYETISSLTKENIGQSTCVGIGGDPVCGSTFADILQMFEKDPDTKAVIMLGEIGGSAEEEAAAFVKEHFSKPVVAFIAGQAAPPGKRMGHAGAIISRGRGSAAEKIEALKSAGIKVATIPIEIPQLIIKGVLGS
jgi:succinyl-CoA synthetase alpha subunit